MTTTVTVYKHADSAFKVRFRSDFIGKSQQEIAEQVEAWFLKFYDHNDFFYHIKKGGK